MKKSLSFLKQTPQPNKMQTVSQHTSNNERLSTYHSKFTNISIPKLKIKTEQSVDIPSFFKQYPNSLTSRKEQTFLKDIKQSYTTELKEMKILNSPQQNQDQVQFKIDVLQFVIMSCTHLQQMKMQRSEAIKIIQEIFQAQQKLKNLDLKAIIMLALAKITYLYKLYRMSINYSKNAKRLSDCENLIKYKWKAYKLLAKNFMALQYIHQAKIYTTKYLMCSWKLNLKNEELKAYDILGKLYYYSGELEQAKIFHNKMVLGHILDQNSKLRILGISKLEQGSISKGFQQKQHYDDQYNISSDDEPFNVIFNLNDEQSLFSAQKSIEQLVQNQKRQSLIQFPIRRRPNFEKRGQKQVNDQIRQANDNIRIRKDFTLHTLTGPDGQIDFNLIKKYTKQLSTVGAQRSFVFLNHLSPNRSLMNFQQTELNKFPDGRNLDQIEPLFQKSDLKDIDKILTKQKLLLAQCVQWLNEQIQKF